MIGRLPPLNALRAFEASARHLSVKNAAAELCVTPGAVSQLVAFTFIRHAGSSVGRGGDFPTSLSATPPRVVPRRRAPAYHYANVR
jgi:hypothetical protein